LQPGGALYLHRPVQSVPLFAGTGYGPALAPTAEPSRMSGRWAP
jgi:hypothetical protein